MELKTDQELSDSQLLFLIRESNEDAKDFLYEKYSPMIHKEINRVKNIAYTLGIDYADLSQEAMLGFSNAINYYNEDEPVKFLTFAILCVRRKLYNLFKKHTTNKNSFLKATLTERENEDNLSYIENLSDLIGYEPLNKMITEESIEETVRLIKEKLSDNEKKALLYNLEGKTVEETAKKMKMTSKQIYNLLYRARQKLKIE